jgi:hypothetical protein
MIGCQSDAVDNACLDLPVASEVTVRLRCRHYMLSGETTEARDVYARWFGPMASGYRAYAITRWSFAYFYGCAGSGNARPTNLEVVLRVDSILPLSAGQLGDRWVEDRRAIYAHENAHALNGYLAAWTFVQRARGVSAANCSLLRADLVRLRERVSTMGERIDSTLDRESP